MVKSSVLIAKLCLTSIRAFCYESFDIDVCGATGLSQWRVWTGSNLFASVPNLEITMKTLILAAIRCSLMFLVTAAPFSVRPAQAYTVTLDQVGSNGCRGHRPNHIYGIHRTGEFRERGPVLRQHWQRRLRRHFGQCRDGDWPCRASFRATRLCLQRWSIG